ncbi:hypothetical protein BTO05_06595 [Winogradskyella sp. PC-19]|uniref:hypothetical protein n=1 Tax=unclassified Winogradskyella TaxID=2615021 RepID=UPI000B3BE34F|nr:MULTISPECIES: hypothetical protein [unclassified Winogradskyella]ARV09321.1 hypothetical protein BTO05_06595 [Winogradskyella sp. PC-19]
MDKLISRINLEHRTLSGKYNTLKIWEVYNLDMFKKEHAKNSDYLKVTDSPYFNFDPYYSSEVKVETIQVN